MSITKISSSRRTYHLSGHVANGLGGGFMQPLNQTLYESLFYLLTRKRGGKVPSESFWRIPAYCT